MPYSLLQIIVPSSRFLASATCHFVARRYRRIHSLVKKNFSCSDNGAVSFDFLFEDVGNSLMNFRWSRTSLYLACSSAFSSTRVGRVEDAAGASKGNLRGVTGCAEGSVMEVSFGFSSILS